VRALPPVLQLLVVQVTFTKVWLQQITQSPLLLPPIHP
jgi:hypothetical protein